MLERVMPPQFLGRTYGTDVAREAIAYAIVDQTMFAVSLLELDRFEAYGQMFGPAVGARLLDAAAVRLRSFVRCDYVAHIPEAAFVILIKAISGDGDVASFAEEILSAIAEPLLIQNVPVLRVTANMGIAVYPSDARDAQTLLDLAVAALLYSKARGRNTFWRHLARSGEPGATASTASCADD